MLNLESMGDQEQFYKLILKSVEYASEGIVILDNAGMVVYVNEAAERLTKFPKNKLVGKWITDPQFKIKSLEGKLLKPEERPFYKVSKNGISTSNFEAIIEKSDGVNIVVALNLVPLKKNDVVTYVVMSFTDITKLKEDEEKLKESEERYKHIVNDSPDGITVYKDGKIIFVNPAAVSIIKAKNREELIGKQIRTFIHPKYKQIVAKRAKKMITTGETVPLMEEKLIRLDGKIIDVEVAASPIIFGGSKAIQVIFRDITERKKSEKSIREHEKRFRQMLEKIEMIALILDTKGNITFANDYLLKISGWSRDEIIGKNWFDLFIPKQKIFIIQQVFFSLLAGESSPSNYENEILTKNGKKLTISFTNLVIKDLDQNTIGIASIGQDVTERRKTDKELRESEERFHLIFKHAPIAIALVSLDRKFITVNPFLEKMFHRTADELIGANPNELTFHEDRERDRQLFNELSQGLRDYYKIEKRYITKDGKIIWGYLTNTIVKDNNGDPLYALASVEDITERKEFENELEDKGRQFQTVVETTSDAIVLCRDGKIIFWNKSAEHVFGYKAKEIIDKPISILMPTSEISEKHNNGLERYIKTGTTKIISKKPYETFAKSKDGKIFPIELSLARNYYEKGISFTGVIRDITDRKKTEKELAQSKQQYQLFLETATDAIIQCQNGLVTYWNKSAEKIFGYKEGEILGREVISLMPERFIDDHLKGINMFTSTGESKIVGKKTFEIYGKRKDGSEVPLELSVAKDTIDNKIFFTAILRDISERKKSERELENAYKESEIISTTLQKSLLPREIPKIDDLEIKFYYQATGVGEVGGDFYDVFETALNTYGILVGDVSGKGITVASETARVKYLLRDRAFDGSSPSKVMSKINNSLTEQKIAHFAALTYALYNPDSSTIEIVNAGNPLPYFVTEDNFLEITGMPVSLFSNQEYKTKSLKLNKGDSLLFFSDGIIEARRNKDLFGEERIKKYVMKNKNSSLDVLLKGLVGEARKFSKNNLRDDILVVGIKKQ